MAFLAGCQWAAVHEAEHGQAATVVQPSSPTRETVAAALMPADCDLQGPHPVEDYLALALAQNPAIQARRKRIEAAALRVPQAASLKDPTLASMGYPFFPHVPQTAAGRMTVDLTASQEVPWPGKLGAQAGAAEAETDMARAELAATELEVVEQVKRAYYELYYVERSIEITTESRELARSLAKIAEAQFRTGKATEQDLLRAQLEVAQADTELVRLRQELRSAEARLARWLHVSPDTPLRTLSQLPAEQVPNDLRRLYESAIAARPELQTQLAAIRRERFGTDLARLRYFPDVAFSMGWGEMTRHKALAPSADGIDDVSIGLMANIPIYYGRLSAGVREAEAKVVASAHEYENLRDRTEEEVKDLFAQAVSQEELLRLFRSEIIPKAGQTLRASIPAYQTGKIDFLQLIDNWRQLLRYRIMQQRLEAQLRQSLASLERVVGGTLPRPMASADSMPAPPAPPTPWTMPRPAS